VTGWKLEVSNTISHLPSLQSHLIKIGNRKELVIATKYTTLYKHQASIKANYCGNHYKSMVDSVNASLEKLKTNYIDILYVHWWEYTVRVF
jgi:aryl-alcohol dehydrogenase-like predicted oxidoreductase